MPDFAVRIVITKDRDILIVFDSRQRFKVDNDRILETRQKQKTAAICRIHVDRRNPAQAARFDNEIVDR